jgi:hypothetical protein
MVVRDKTTQCDKENNSYAIKNEKPGDGDS